MTTYLDGLADPEVLPRVDDVNRGHFEAAAKGRLAVRQCTACDLLFHYPRPFCPRCHCARLRWTDVSGEATVVVSAVVSRPPWNDLPRAAPYPVVIVRLAEGPQMLSTVEHCDPASVVPGMAVRAAFERVGDIGLVRFVPAS
ncbi:MULTISPECIES: Zn-ribbon domain-containing OB-fold protein [Pseudonocardia]|uniref:OB-fold domain-containing protein n=1 Tax=Pseudonocardia abyssalis TaxID=2792008 RepID=A0ABS6V2U1_9PSEU|nr:OB-fold domain-containing protein [Pseudonocardia abyssalis]MBW0113663.1 OB-fold domain-containing protein [Pseudonocardia abyssalis]MBW0138344.1 OB-fold domain-containing protein [Pseudonocardia abyssalis]